MALELDTRTIDCEDVKKCGEITALLTTGKLEFFLNCGFCNFIFGQSECFMQHKHRNDSEDVRKCGEITTSISLGNQEFIFNCSFCYHTFRQLNIFVQHMNEQHLSEFPERKLKEDAVGLSPLHSVDVKAMNLALHLQEEMTGVNSCMQTETAVVESDDNKIFFKDFERVEVELDPFEMHNSPNVKDEVMSEGCMSDDSNNNFEDANEVDLVENNGGESGSGSEAAADEQAHELVSMFPENTMQAIFSSYGKHPTLWDTEVALPTHSRKREQVFKSIADDVGLPTEWDNIRILTAKLSAKLRTEMVRKKMFESKGKTYTPAWYKDLNAFLKPISQSTQVPTRLTNRKIIIRASLLNDAQCLMIAEIYKNSPCLWNEKDIKYRFSNRRQEALQAIREEFNTKSGLCLSQSEVINEIARLRKMCSDEKRKKIKCKRQNLEYKPACHYYEHISFLEVDVNPFECGECGELFSGLCQYKIHVSSHDGTPPFKCHVCGHGFKMVGNLTVHLRRHARDFIYNCDVCSKTFATAAELEIHMRCHTGEMPYVCDVCGKKFRSSCEVNKHMERHENRPRHKCEMCPKRFYTKGMLREHMTVHIKIRDKICNVCNKGFTSIKQLRQHQHIHDEEKKYLCKICGKRFAQYAGLSRHMKTHGTTIAGVTIQIYSCEVCGKKLQAAAEFSKHMEQHESHPRHKCEICSEGFYTKRILKEHMSVHKTVQEKLCEVCNKGFTSIKKLRQHKQIHAEQKKYVCMICGKSYAQSKGLGRHMKTHNRTLPIVTTESADL